MEENYIIGVQHVTIKDGSTTIRIREQVSKYKFNILEAFYFGRTEERMPGVVIEANLTTPERYWLANLKADILTLKKAGRPITVQLQLF